MADFPGFISTPSGNDNDIVTLDSSGNLSARGHLGWIALGDGRYNTSSRLSILSGVKTKLTLDLNNLSFFEGVNLALNYDTINDKFLPIAVNDFYAGEVRFRCEAAQGDRDIEVLLESPGFAFNPISGNNVPLARTAAAEQFVSVQADFFTGIDAVNNGLEVYVTPAGSNVEIWDISFIFQRTFAGV